MRSLLTLVALFVPLVATGADDQVVKAMSKATGITEAEIREHGEKGCESGVQLHMTICSLYHYYEKDGVLNSTYKLLMGRLQEQSSREELRAAQRAWVAFRDAHCLFDTTASTGGSIRPMANAACLNVMTEARTKQLQEALDCQGEECPEFRDE